MCAFNAVLADDIPDWELYHTIRGMTVVSLGVLADNGVRHHSLLAKRADLLQSLWTIGQTRCQACNGYGHGAKHCPTNGKLDQLRILGGKWLLTARNRVSANHADDAVVRHNVRRLPNMNAQ